MNFNFLDVFIVVGVMLLMVVPGFILRKLKAVDKSALGALAVILLYVCQPFLTIKAFVLSAVEPSGAIAVNMLIMFGLAFAVHIIGFLFVKLIFHKSKDKLKTGAYTVCSLFSNAGFIGIPFVELLTGNDTAVIYATVFMCAFNMLMWTLGVYIITGDIKMMKPLKGILNPAVIVLVIAVPLFFLPSLNIFKKVYVLGEGIKYFGNATLPLSMLIVGIRMADIPFKELFTNLRLYLVAAVKLIFIPLLTLALMLPLLLTGALKELDPNNYIVLVIVMLTAISPAASSIAMSERYLGDTDTAVKGFLLTTLLSIVTLPAILTLLLAVI